MLDRLDIQPIRLRAAVATCALDGGVAGATQPCHEWHDIAIVGAGVPVLGFNTSDSDLLYARADIEGAYRWNPSTRRWIPLLHCVELDQWNLTDVESLATNSANLDRLNSFAGACARMDRVRGVFRATDTDLSWVRVNDDASSSTLRAEPPLATPAFSAVRTPLPTAAESTTATFARRREGLH